MLYAVLLCSLEQCAARARVIAVVLQRIGDGFRHDRVGGEVHDRINGVLGKDAIQESRIAGLADDQFTGSDGPPEAGTQIIEDDDVFARSAELPHDMAADVTGPTRDQYAFVFHAFSRSENNL